MNTGDNLHQEVEDEITETLKDLDVPSINEMLEDIDNNYTEYMNSDRSYWATMVEKLRLQKAKLGFEAINDKFRKENSDKIEEA
jgi:hypothetical protein